MNPPFPRQKTDLLALFDAKRSAGDYVKVCAPMVRYSKLAFRELVRGYNTDIAYTPMILADVFVASPFARDSEFTTLPSDGPVVLQLAAKNADEFASAAVLAGPYVDAVDVNCGCPQKWAYKDRIGAYLMERPDLIADMMSTLRRRAPEITRTVKIRVHADVRETVELARRAEAAGAEFITVHGRTRHQKSTEPVNLDAIATVKAAVSVPVVANGDVFSLGDADRIVAATKVDGVMAARGLLANPALFAGYAHAPVEAARRYLDLALRCGTHPFVIHHHLMYMLDAHHMSGWEKKRFNVCTSVPAMVDWFAENYGWSGPAEPLNPPAELA
ncbi:tRNA dihydrouridine synthase [Blastocladiella emersonii ATCC 22665]|nr:tRNA dihydrouridine synthase [Blastocladiella emersonii ATCC 22665]